MKKFDTLTVSSSLRNPQLFQIRNTFITINTVNRKVGQILLLYVALYTVCYKEVFITGINILYLTTYNSFKNFYE